MTSHQTIQFREKVMISEHQEDVKPPRACELCLTKQAVWYCASDDAFLCRVCDESVHSANQVATKHERVCLRTNELSNDVLRGTTSKPVWHSGFRRKARTPRVRCDKKPQEKIDDESRRRRREDTRVPEIGSEGMFFIPGKQDDELASLVPEFQGFTEMGFFFRDEIDVMEDLYYNENEEAKPDGNEQTLMSCKQDCNNVIAITTKTEENEDYESNTKQRNMLLRLNYEDVIAAWDKQESPRDYTSSLQLVPPGVEEKKLISKSEREARVWRYRDKRKNRLFEKKIRYEVRKVNADKRPRMKGRFVRRSLANDS